MSKETKKTRAEIFLLSYHSFSFLHRPLSLHIHVQSVSIFFQNPPNTRIVFFVFSDFFVRVTTSICVCVQCRRY